MNITDRTTSSTIWNTFTRTATKPPKPVADAHAAMADLTQRASRLRVDGSDLAPAVTATFTAGRDPASDPEVQRVVTAIALSGNQALIQTVEAEAVDTFRGVCTERHDDIVSAWRTTFDAAAEKLAACFERIGPVPLEDVGTIMVQGGDIASVWAEARKASATIGTIEAGWAALGEFTRTVTVDPNRQVLRLAAVDFETWQAKGLRRARLTPWEYLLAGLALSLPTLDEYRSRVSVIEEAEAAPEMVVDRERSHIAGREIRVPVR